MIKIVVLAAVAVAASAAVAPSSDCVDDPDWVKKGKPEDSGCDWVAVDPLGRCKKKNEDGEKAWDACECACALGGPVQFYWPVSHGILGWLLLVGTFALSPKRHARASG